MARLQLAGGGDSLQICSVATIAGGASKATFVFREGQGISSATNKKKVSHDGAVQRETAKYLCDLTFDSRTKPYIASEVFCTSRYFV
jgi:hypothetical protein